VQVRKWSASAENQRKSKRRVFQAQFKLAATLLGQADDEIMP